MLCCLNGMRNWQVHFNSMGNALEASSQGESFQEVKQHPKFMHWILVCHFLACAFNDISTMFVNA